MHGTAPAVINYQYLGEAGICSGYFNPLNQNHIDYLKAARKLCDYLIVIVNNTEQCLLKHGYEFIPLETRINILKELRCVDSVYPSIDLTLDVSATIQKIFIDLKDKIKLRWIYNGGDIDNNCREAKVATQLGLECVYAVGGGLKDKITSSSQLLNNYYSHKLNPRGRKLNPAKHPLCFDLDSTVVDPCDKDGNRLDYPDRSPYPYAVDRLKKLKQQGFTIFFLTARYMELTDNDPIKAHQRGYWETKAWLDRHEVPYDKIFMGKPNAGIFIDDLACRVNSGESGEAAWKALEYYIE